MFKSIARKNIPGGTKKIPAGDNPALLQPTVVALDHSF
jgi:hypothetical protein